MDLEEHDFPDMKNKCLKFANNMAINRPTKKNDNDAMNLDSVEEKGDEDVDIETLNALQRQNLQCHTCKGWGHFTRDCPSKSDGPPQKGKGKGKDSPKGGKGGNNGGCAICHAMDHWKNECPQNTDKGKGKGYQPLQPWGEGGGKGGKGKGKPGFRSLEEWFNQAWENYDGVQKLCGLGTVSAVRLPQSDMDGADPVPVPPVPVRAPISRKKRIRMKPARDIPAKGMVNLTNSFQGLCCEGDVCEAPCSHDLEDAEDDGPPVLIDSDTDEDKKIENKFDIDEDSDDDDEDDHKAHSNFWDMIKKKDEMMKGMIEKAIEKNNFEIHRMKRQTKGWKTVARKTRKPTTFQAGIENLLNPQVTEVAMPPEVSTARICPLKAIEPQEIKAFMDNDGWMSVDMAVDSAATETVLNEEMLENIETTIGEANKRGVEYEVANGIRIPNLGEKVFKGHSDDGIIKSLTAQVCDVNKALLSVRRIVENGHKVVFDQGGSYIEDKASGEKMWLREEGGMYMLKMWVRTPTKGPF